jgi:hypothetical protein
VNYKLELLMRKYKRSGAIGVTKAIFFLAMRKISPFEVRADLRRRKIGRKLHREFGGQVRYGAFKGLKMPISLVWAKNDLASILIGFYEQQVIEWISNKGIRFLQFIDIGSADGFYLAGILKAELAESAIGFESSILGRASSQRLLELNDLQKKSNVMGVAESNFMEFVSKSVDENKNRWSLLICDIEGGEIDLFNPSNVKLLNRYFLVVELHEWTYKSGDLENFLSIFSSSHSLDFIGTAPRNPSSVVEIQKLSDDERWNLCSEGRRHEMRWLVGTPLLYQSQT